MSSDSMINESTVPLYLGSTENNMSALIDVKVEETKLAELYRRYEKIMISYAQSIVKNQQDAEDVVHNVFLRIVQKNWDRVRNISNETDLRNYLLKATKNMSLNAIKLSKKYVGEIYDGWEDGELEGVYRERDEFLEDVSNKIQCEEIARVIAGMDEKYGRVLHYHLIQELSIAETAKRLGQSVDTTKKQLHRGRRLLLELLDGM